MQVKKYVYVSTVAAIFSGLFLVFPTYYESSDWMQKSALQTRDLFFRIRRWSAGPQDRAKAVTIVAIDEESCAKLEARWPWSRRTFATMIDNLSAAGARAVGLNVSFTGLESGDAESTDLLAASMKRHGNVVIGATFNKGNAMVKPSAAIAESVRRYGYLEKIIDSDFVIRRSYVLRPYEGTSQFEASFPLQLAAAAAGPSRDGDPDFDRDLNLVTVGVPHVGLKVEPDGSYPINYTALEDDFRQIPAWKAVQNRLSPADVRGKIVLVGLTSALFADRHPTPLGTMSGIAIHANELLEMQSGRSLQTVPPGFAYFVSWLLGVLVLAAFLFGGLWIGLLAFGLTFGGVFLGTQALWARDVVFEPLLLFLGPVLGIIAGVVSNSVRLFLVNRGLEKKIIHDKMTGLYNYDYLRMKLEEEWGKSKKDKQPLSLVMTDLDRFKKINDTMGHETGNEMIKRAGAVLKQTARGYDVVARYGGDEFFVLLWHTGHEEARAYRERLRAAYHEMARKLDDERLHDSSISIGIATFNPKIDPKRPESTQKLLEEADQDLLIDKESRRKPGEPRR